MSANIRQESQVPDRLGSSGMMDGPKRNTDQPIAAKRAGASFRTCYLTASPSNNPRYVSMRSPRFFSVRAWILCVLILPGSLTFNWSGTAGEVPHLSILQPGGMPGLPIMTGATRTTNGFEITWDGPSGYYRVYQKSDSGTNWTVVGGPNLERHETITAIYSNAFFRVSGPKPNYAGAATCRECHGDIHDNEMNTRHAHALDTLKNAHQVTNPSCLPCHTVGFGLPTGFVSENQTPWLAGVQCENCHGPAANHAANPEDLAVRPRREIAATVCGGCHTGSHHPTFDEWHGTGHAEVVEDMSPASRVDSCGRCHSGSARLALLQGKSALTVTNDANVGIVCITCHDPHKTNGFPAQLRNPVASSKDYFISTSVPLADQYDANVNICAQCHNHRGASYTSSSRPPHHSPQYNMLIGSVGELAAGGVPNQPGGHARLIEKQCVGCHMQTAESQGESQPALTGHSFKVQTYEGCLQCHPFPELLTAFTATAVTNQIQQIKASLDLWATTKAPEALRTKYGIRAWEFTNPGSLSTGGTGPSSSEQGQIPDGIKKARFNLYLVLYDGSFGVHNGPYSIKLLDAARDWVQQELNK